MNGLHKTALHDWHVDQGARMVEFAGWSMPVQYSSIVEEHRATRQAVGLFDISHMGRLAFDGQGAAELLDLLLTRRVLPLAPRQVRYALVTNEQGGVLDDVLVYRLDQQQVDHAYLLVVNASNRLKILDWIQRYRGQFPAANVTDQTFGTAMIAIQGPKAIELVRSTLGIDVAPLKYYTVTTAQLGGKQVLVSRTGYTGEDGCELIVPATMAREVWNPLIEAGQSVGLRAAGLGARDTLRLEAALPLYGHELTEEVDPYQAGLGFAIQLDEHEFVGREALLKLKTDPERPRRIGLELSGRRVPRQDCPILKGDERVGRVTSGTFSPTLDRPIAIGYVDPSIVERAAELVIDIRGRREPARVVQLPFYKRSSR